MNERTFMPPPSWSEIARVALCLYTPEFALRVPSGQGCNEELLACALVVLLSLYVRCPLERIDRVGPH